MIVKANAKLNLCLHIKSIRKDGFHEIDSVFQSIRLFDTITVKKYQGIDLSCDKADVPLDARNTCYKMVALLTKEYGIEGAKISIEKNIPSCAGLGGASADAAAVLFCLDRIYDLELSSQTKNDIAKQIGADVPFFLLGGCQRATGIGEKLEKVDNPFAYEVIVIKPYGGVSTPKAYQLFDKIGRFYLGKNQMIHAMMAKDEQEFLSSFSNDLQTPAFEIQNNCIDAHRALLNAGALTAMVTGSGSAVFGVFKDAKAALKHIDQTQFERVILTQYTNESIIVI